VVDAEGWRGAQRGVPPPRRKPPLRKRFIRTKEESHTAGLGPARARQAAAIAEDLESSQRQLEHRGGRERSRTGSNAGLDGRGTYTRQPAGLDDDDAERDDDRYRDSGGAEEAKASERVAMTRRTRIWSLNNDQ
jgi:hypothetical protein